MANYKTGTQNRNRTTTEVLKGEDITDSGRTGKETTVQEDFLWLVGPEALHQITRAEYKAEPDSINLKDLIWLYIEHYLPKRNKCHSRRNFLWAMQFNPRMKHRKNFGDSYSKSGKSGTFTQFQPKNQ